MNPHAAQLLPLPGCHLHVVPRPLQSSPNSSSQPSQTSHSVPPPSYRQLLGACVTQCADPLLAGYSWREAGMEELMRQQQPDSEAAAPGGSLLVEAGAGTVAFRVQSWMDSLAKKFAAPKEG